MVSPNVSENIVSMDTRMVSGQEEKVARVVLREGLDTEREKGVSALAGSPILAAEPESYLPRGTEAFGLVQIGMPIDDPNHFLPLERVPAGSVVAGQFIGDPETYLPREYDTVGSLTFGRYIDDPNGFTPEDADYSSTKISDQIIDDPNVFIPNTGSSLEKPMPSS